MRCCRACPRRDHRRRVRCAIPPRWRATRATRSCRCRAVDAARPAAHGQADGAARTRRSDDAARDDLDGTPRPARPDRRAGSQTACSAASSRMPPTCRSAPRFACSARSPTSVRLIEARPAARLTRYFPPMVGEVPAGVLPAEWLPASDRRLRLAREGADQLRQTLGLVLGDEATGCPRSAPAASSECRGPGVRRSAA